MTEKRVAKRKKQGLIVFTVYVPTNRGLRIARGEGSRYIRELCTWYAERESRPMQYEEKEARGEDIPKIIKESVGSARVIGITGEDILLNFYSGCKEIKEMNGFNCRFGTDVYGAEGRTGVIRLEELGLKEKEAYPDALFGVPALCLIGKGVRDATRWNSPLECRPYQLKTIIERMQRENSGTINIAVDQRYAAVAKNLVDVAINGIGQDEQPKTVINWCILDGKVDVTAALDPTIDYAIDIVLSGKTCRENGLGIYAKLFESDGVIVGNRKAAELNWDLGRLKERWGMQRLEVIAKGDGQLTYEALKSLKEQISNSGCSGGIH